MLHYFVSSSYSKFRNKNKFLGYGFKTDAAMLIASYPIFHRAVFSGKTLLDLSLVQNEIDASIFPYATLKTNTSSKDKGLSELVRLCFGKPLNKSEQCSNWERRPLRSAQRLYAGKNLMKIILILILYFCFQSG
jgi:hypothetical protein